MVMAECSECHKPYPSPAAADACCRDEGDTYGDQPFWRSVN